NNTFDQLTKATQYFTIIDFGSGDVTLTIAQLRDNVLFRSTGNTEARNLALPATLIRRLFIVHNNGTATLTVVRGSASVEIPAEQARLLYADGTANGLISIAGGSGGAAEVSVVEVSGTARTLTAADNGALIIFDSPEDCVITLPDPASEELSAGFHALVRN